MMKGFNIMHSKPSGSSGSGRTLRNILAGGAAALLLLSCSVKDDLGELPGDLLYGDAPLEFSLGAPATRSQDLTTSTVTSFSVFGYYTRSPFNSATAVPNYMFDTHVSGSLLSGFTYTPLKYWPNTPTDRLSFIAFAPADAYVSLPSASSAGLPDITYSTASTATAQDDFLVSDFIGNLSPSSKGSPVVFTFRHVLADVSFRAKLAAGVTRNATISAISVTSDLTGVYSTSSQEWTSTSGSGAASASVSQTVSSSSPTDVTGADFKLVPQSLSGVSVTVTWRLQGDASDRTTTVSGTDLGSMWEKGTTYTYVIEISEDGPVATLTVTPDTIVLGAEVAANRTASFDIETSGAWTVTGAPSWLTVSPASGTDDGTVTLTAGTNTGDSERTATLTVTAGALTRSVYVTQNYKLTNEELSGISDMGGSVYEDENIVVDLSAASDGILGKYFTVWGTKTLVFTAKDGRHITKITFSYQRTPGSVTPDTGTYSGTSWTGNAETVNLTMSTSGLLGYAAIKSITVSFD